jgi:hypothetical protein
MKTTSYDTGKIFKKTVIYREMKQKMLFKKKLPLPVFFAGKSYVANDNASKQYKNKSA